MADDANDQRPPLGHERPGLREEDPENEIELDPNMAEPRSSPASGEEDCGHPIKLEKAQTRTMRSVIK